MSITKENSPSQTLIILAFATVYIVWGSTYMANKVVIQEIPPFISATMRFTVAAAIIFLIAWILKLPFDLSWKKVLNAGWAGIFFLTLGNGGVVWALQYVDSGFTALLVSAQPLVLIIMMYFADKKPISPRALFGIFLGILGIYLLTSDTQVKESANYFLGLTIIFCCLLFWGYGSLFVKKATFPQNVFINSAVQMLIGGLLMAPISLCLGEDWSKISHASTGSWLTLLYLILFGSIAAYSSFNFLLRYVSPEKVATNTYVNPVVAMILGYLILKEPITPRAIIAAVILLTGVFVINTRKVKVHDS
jgi:drug/metabolite transporter (DMT)-like permease